MKYHLCAYRLCDTSGHIRHTGLRDLGRLPLVYRCRMSRSEGGVCVTLGLGPGFGCRSPACASRYRRVMLCGCVGIILFFLVTDIFGNGGGFLVS